MDPGAGALDFSDLGSALDHCAAQQQDKQQQARRKDRQKGHEAGAAGGPGAAEAPHAHPSTRLPHMGPPLPEFYIHAVEEPPAVAGPSADPAVQHLLEEYQRAEGGAAAGGGAAGSGPDGARAAGCGGRGGRSLGAAALAALGDSDDSDEEGPATSGAAFSPAPAAPAAAAPAAGSGRAHGGRAKGAGGGGSGRQAAAAAEGSDGSDGEAEGGGAGGRDVDMEGGSEAEDWAGETYEEDHVRGVATSYLRFAARLARQPDQCARYARGGEVLWPLRSRPAPPPCPCCGAPRVFELQLMAPLLAVVLECAEWLQGPDLEAHAPAINAAANWDLATLAVYTCSASCAGGAGGGEGRGGVALVEECAVLVNEEQCHVAEELKLGA